MLHICEKLHFFEKSHLFRALLSGNVLVAQVQVLIDGIDYIFLFGQLLCCATQATSLVHLTLNVLLLFHSQLEYNFNCERLHHGSAFV
jgi:hypothetical protein